MNSSFLPVTCAKWIKYEAGSGTPEANGTSEPIRNARPKNGTRRYTWCIDRFDCFPRSNDGNNIHRCSRFSRISQYFLLAGEFRSSTAFAVTIELDTSPPTTGKNSSLKNDRDLCLRRSFSFYFIQRRCEFRRETRHFRTNWKFAGIPLHRGECLGNASVCVSRRGKMRAPFRVTSS